MEKISFAEIPPKGLFWGPESWPEDWPGGWLDILPVAESGSFRVVDRPVVSVRLTKITDSRVLVEGSLCLLLSLVCDRCLREFSSALQSDFSLQLSLVGTSSGQDDLADYICDSEEMDVVELDLPLVDLADCLRQQFYLALPEKKLCGEACPGLCPVCGVELSDDGDCSCPGGLSVDSPFAVLKKLSLAR